MIENNFEAVIFDCDGTLVDSEPITTQVLVDYVREFGLELDVAEAIDLFLGRDMRGIVVYLETQLADKLPDHFTDEFRRRQEIGLRQLLKPINGAMELLSSMTRPYCLASNAPPDKIRVNLEVSQLGHFFSADRIFSAYDINVWKPRPDLFLHAAAKIKVAPERCVVIEDSPAGIEAGLAAGMQVIGFSQVAPSAASNGDPASSGTHDVPFVYSLIELIEILG